MAKVTLTKAQWAEIAAVLDRGLPWKTYELRVDGYKLQLNTDVHKRKVVISARQLRLHLERNNEHIELIEPAAAEAATDA